jgi:hypothetical protein
MHWRVIVAHDLAQILDRLLKSRQRPRNLFARIDANAVARHARHVIPLRNDLSDPLPGQAVGLRQLHADTPRRRAATIA